MAFPVLRITTRKRRSFVRNRQLLGLFVVFVRLCPSLFVRNDSFCASFLSFLKSFLEEIVVLYCIFLSFLTAFYLK